VSADSRDNSRLFADLEVEFESVCNAAIDACRHLSQPYHPTAWIGVIAKLRAAAAARRLVVSGDIQTGFGRLVEAGRPELSIEWEILNSRWDPLFSKQHREAARWRLRQAGVEPPR
jgi:hypothetical protein